MNNYPSSPSPNRFRRGFVWGALVGAALAMWLAPRSGRQTRELMRERSLELKDRATDATQRVRQRLGR